MKILETRYGRICLDEIEDIKFITTIEQGYYPNDDILEVFGTFLDKNSVVADVGANVGIVAIPLARVAKEVHCFEPIPRNLELLRRNVELNSLTNVFIHPYALGDKQEILSFFEEDKGNAGTYRWGSKGTVPVEVRTLDSFNLHINAMKIDVQGMESKVLGGVQKTIKTCAPIVLFELSGRNLEIKGAFASIRRVLSSYNLFIPGETYGKVISLWLTMLLKLPGVVLLGRKGYHFDILAIPKSRTIPHHNPLSTLLILLWQLFTHKR
ncbi:MAG: FkbM family methyltransferase [Patescibacteria group bacterium]